MKRKQALLGIFLLLLVALLSGCGSGAELPADDDMALSDQPTFSVLPDTFSAAILERTGLMPVAVSKGSIIRFEEPRMGIVLTAMLRNERISTIVFQVQGKAISSEEAGAYMETLGEVVQIVLPGNELALDESLLFEAQSAALSEGTISATVEKNDLTIMIVPADAI